MLKIKVSSCDQDQQSLINRTRYSAIRHHQFGLDTPPLQASRNLMLRSSVCSADKGSGKDSSRSQAVIFAGAISNRTPPGWITIL